MKRSETELVIGIALALVGCVVVSTIVGVRGLLYVLGLALIGGAAMALWQSKAEGAKVLAACLLPTLALGHVLSKGARATIKRFTDEKQK